MTKPTAAGTVVLVVIGVLTGLINPGNLALLIIVAVVAAAVSYFVIIPSRPVTDKERSRVFAFIPLFIARAAFWSLYQQQFTALNIYSDQRLDRFIGGFEMPVPLGAVDQPGVHHRPLRRVRGDLDEARPPPAGHTGEVRSGHHDNGPGLPAVPAVRGGGPNSTPLLALIGIVLVFTLAELLLSPVGLSVTTKLAPEAFHTRWWRCSTSWYHLGTVISGELARFYSAENEGTYFGVLGVIAIGIGALLAVASPWVLKLMRGVR